MSGHIVLSYGSSDRQLVGRLHRLLVLCGFEVRWDQDLPPGVRWRDEIEQIIPSAGAVVVCWTAGSTVSDNVRAEARRAGESGNLVAVKLEACQPPLPFGEIQTCDLSGWQGEADHDALPGLVAVLRKRCLPEGLLNELRELDRLRLGPFGRWIQQRILRSETLAFRGLVSAFRGQQDASRRGVPNYREQVELQRSRYPAGTILALCGEKGMSEEATLEYFDAFFRFLERNPDPEAPDRVRLCRLFVEPEDGAYAAATFASLPDDGYRVNRQVIQRHDAAGEEVLALVVPHDQRDSVRVEYPGVWQHLREGFGFLVFLDLDQCARVLTHEGSGADIQFAVFEDPLIVREIVLLFEKLCRCSCEYRDVGRRAGNDKATRDRIERLLWRSRRIPICHRGAV